MPPRIALGFAAALLSLAAAAGASYAALRAREVASALVRHTSEARRVIEELESALVISDVALVAHLEDRDPRHLELFRDASARALPALAELERISEQHPDQRPRIARIARDVDVVRSEQAQILASLQAGEPRAGRALESRSAGRDALARALTTLGEIDAVERGAHEGREAHWRRTVLVSNTVFVVAVCVLLALILHAIRLVRDDIRDRDAARAERERAVLVQQRLMAVVSHDLRNPLGVVLAAGARLARMDLPPSASAMARRVLRAGGRMERLVRDVLDWSRVHAGGAIPLSVREGDLLEVCQRMVDELQERERERVRVEHEGETRARFDPDRLEQVAGNLISNALRYATPGTPVVVRAVGTASELRLEVHDDGPVIPPEVQASLFEPFHQGPTGHGAGVGLGLFIVRSLAEAHGGTVELVSAPGDTSFVVRLPRTASAAPAAASG